MRIRSLGGGPGVRPSAAAPSDVRSTTLIRAEALDQHLARAISELKQPGRAPDHQLTPAPVPAATEGATPMTTASAFNPAASALSVKDMMDEHMKLMSQIHTAQLELLRAQLARQRETVGTAVGKVAEKIEGQTADFLAMMGQYANDLG